MVNLIGKRKGEKGQVLLLVLVLLVVGVLLIVSLLGFIGTGTKSGVASLNKTDELYAADAGIQDAVWQVKYGNVVNLKSQSLPTIPYNQFDYSTLWQDTNVSTVNGESVTATIQNDWVVSNVSPPSQSDSGTIISSDQLLVTGSTIKTGIKDGSNTISEYDIKITDYPVSGQTMLVKSIGVWLPPGCTYFSDATYMSTFETYSSSTPYYAKPATSAWLGSHATVWSFSPPYPAFASFPNIMGTVPEVMDVDFYFEPPSDETTLQPQAVSWIVPIGVTIGATPVPVSWDADNEIFKLESTAGKTDVVSYVAKTQERQLASALGGDYYATGNSNLSAVGSSKDRTQWNDPSTATVNNTDIPSNAQVAEAYLYWSGWKADSSATTVLTDPCTNINTYWTPGSSWSKSSTGSYYQGTQQWYSYHDK